MPEFIADDLTPFQTIHVHFDNQEHVDKFAELVGQKITPKTRYIWYPMEEKGQYANMRWVDAETEPEPANAITSQEGETACEAAL